MLPKTGLLLVSNPKQIGQILSIIQKKVGNTLYIQIVNVLTEASARPLILKSYTKYSKTINWIYTQAAHHCKNLDVRVLLSGLKYNIPKIATQKPIDLIIIDKLYNKSEIDNFVSGNIVNLTRDYEVITINSSRDDTDVPESNNEEGDTYTHGVLGGTFDRLHIAHKLLLSETALRSNTKVTIGVTDVEKNRSKVLCELIQEYEQRVVNVENFVKDICPQVELDVVSISDAFGPSIVDPTMDLMVVSQESLPGGLKVNEVREKRDLPKLHIHVVELIDEPNSISIEDTKISSSTTRMRLLGTLIKPVTVNNVLPKRPYIIGLTGGIASGKSGISNWMKQLGAFTIDCDKIGHGIYKLGKPCHTVIVRNFGSDILDESGEIDRKKLGSIVFKDPAQLQKLNDSVWPAMMEDIKYMIEQSNRDVIVIEAAVLLQANWQNYCHEVWSSVVPKEEAIKRLTKRNGLTEEQALLRIQSQPTNSFYVQASNVVFSTLWSEEYTQQQVQKAWNLLLNRMPNEPLQSS